MFPLLVWRSSVLGGYMTAFIKLTVVILATVMATATAAGAAKRIALVISNSAYKHAGELANPRNDATDISAALRKSGFQVLEALDVDKPAFNRKIRDFASALSDAEAGVLFYAGHGLQVAGKNYLAPRRSRALRRSPLLGSARNSRLAIATASGKR